MNTLSDEQKLAEIYDLVHPYLNRHASELGDTSRAIARVIFNGELGHRPAPTVFHNSKRFS